MKRILLAEDDKKLRETLAHLLGDYEVVQVENWPDQLAMLDNEKEHFDMVVTDIVMPGYKELVNKHLPDIYSARKIPVIFISGYTEKAMTGLPKSMRFVKKPFSIRVFKAFVDTLIEQGWKDE